MVIRQSKTLSPALSQREREKRRDTLMEREKSGDILKEKKKGGKKLEAAGRLPSPFGRGNKGEGKKRLSPEQLCFIRELRKNTTDAKRLLWGLLRNRRLDGFKFRRQHPVGKYVLDFYCHEVRLGVELDGGQHNEENNIKRDRARSDFLAKEGVRVVRFWNNEVLRETEGVLEALFVALNRSVGRKDALSPALSQREREKSGDTLMEREDFEGKLEAAGRFPSPFGRGNKGEGK